MELPLIYHEAYRYWYIVAGGVIFFIFYLTIERILIFRPKKVPELGIDRQIPFWPWTIWIYQATAPFMLLLFLLAQNPTNLNSLIFAYTTLMVGGAFIFFFFPTTVPRDIYPIPTTTDAWTRWNFEKLREVDKPVNCVPSMHVALTLLFTLLFVQEQQHLLPYFSIFGLAIVLSTMTTKQHYFIDVIAGALAGVGVYLLYF